MAFPVVLDAAICASAGLSGAEILLSEDMQDGIEVDGGRVCKPFRGGGRSG